MSNPSSENSDFLPHLPPPPAIPQDASDEAAMTARHDAMDAWLEAMSRHQRALESWSVFESMKKRLEARGLEIPKDFVPPSQFHEELRAAMQELIDRFHDFATRPASTLSARKGAKRKSAMQSI